MPPSNQFAKSKKCHRAINLQRAINAAANKKMPWLRLVAPRRASRYLSNPPRSTPCSPKNCQTDIYSLGGRLWTVRSRSVRWAAIGLDHINIHLTSNMHKTRKELSRDFYNTNRTRIGGVTRLSFSGWQHSGGASAKISANR